RLKPGVAWRDVQAQLAVVFDQFRKAGLAQERQQGIDVVRYQDWLATDVRLSLWLLFLAVGLLLLIAAANVASLILARAGARQREICIRLAQGATRGRLMAQFLCESLLLALAGGVAGLFAASWTVDTLAASIPWDVASVR